MTLFALQLVERVTLTNGKACDVLNLILGIDHVTSSLKR